MEANLVSYEIERIVTLIERTTDEDVKKVLKQYLVGIVNKSLVVESLTPFDTPGSLNVGCSVCGIGKNGESLMYSCTNFDCPLTVKSAN